MKIIQYLIVLILVSGEPTEIKVKDFDTFSLEIKLQEQKSCEEFSKSKKRDAYIKKYFNIKENVVLEPICLTTEQFGEWAQSVRKYKPKPSPINSPNSDKNIKQDSANEYIGILRYKEPSSI